MHERYEGGCHCGAVRFAVDLDISVGTEKCNCTICVKMRLWSFRALADAFALLQGQDALADYVYGSEVAHHYFCRHCGIHAFDRVDLADVSYYNIAVHCIDSLDINALMAAPVTYQDGLHDAWEKMPDEVRHL